jgi:uncharacterized membrane protein YqaE (UPF0057 family)
MTSAIGILAGLTVLVPIVSFAIVAGLTVTFLQLGITLALLGYLLGVPYAIGFRLAKGRWPEY